MLTHYGRESITPRILDRGNMRKKFLINKDFQIKFIIFMSILGLITLLSTYLVLQSYFKEFETLANQSGLASNHPFRDLLNFQQNKMSHFFLILAGFNFLLIFSSGIWMSHRIAGPIHRIVESLKDRSSDREEIKTRAGDFFPELPEVLNKIIMK